MGERGAPHERAAGGPAPMDHDRTTEGELTVARHSTGENNYSVSKGFIAFLVIVALALAGAAYAWKNRDSLGGQSDTVAVDCAEGDVQFKVAASTDSPVIDELTAYQESSPVVQDHCVKASVTDDINAAAGIAVAGTPDSVQQYLAQSGRSGASENWPIAAETKLGLAHKDGTDFPAGDWNNLRSLEVAFPSDNPTVSTAVAAALANGDAGAASELLEKGQVESLDAAVSEGRPVIAVSESQTPAGYSFHSPDGFALPTYFVPLTATDNVSELEARAAFDFASSLTGDNTIAQPDDTHARWLAAGAALSGAGQAPADQSAAQAESVEPRDTLILLDASAAMSNVAQGSENSWLSEAQSAVADYVRAVGGAGKSVSLWNYSSPLNPGVTKGWRQNVTFDAGQGGQEAADHVVILGADGESWTRSSVLAALSTAADRSRQIQAPVDLTVLTTGTADRGDDAAFVDQLGAARGDADVRVNVIHIGRGEHDEALEQWAESTAGMTTDVATPEALRMALTSLAPQQN